MEDEREELLDDLYKLYKDIDDLELVIEKLEIRYDDNSDNMVLAELNVLRDNLKDKQAEYNFLEEDIV